MKINIVAASKIKKDSSLGLLIDNYVKRFHQFKVKIVEFDEKNLSQEKINKRLFSLTKDDSFIILLDEKGESFSTSNFKSFLISLSNYKSISFLIAGSDGFTEGSKQRSSAIISLSSLTFPHQIARLLLIEQLYRVQSLLQNHPYHRE